jgi:O-antigen/teichoic acid export membrane protein
MRSFVKWIGLLSTTGAWQAAIAAVGFASGIAVVRLLDVEQYALYTIANSLLGALVVLGDSGISSGVTAQAGAVWQDRNRLGAVIATGLSLCRLFAILAAIVAVPAGLLLLGKHGASPGVALANALVLIPCFAISVRNNILQVPLKLHQDLNALQRTQLGMNAVRLVLLGGLLSFAPFAFTALVAATASTFFANTSLLRRGELHAEGTAGPDPAVRREIMRVVWRMLPGSTYYCIQGQLTIWLISAFGSTDSVAQLGALGRLGMITSVVASVAATLVIPRFARLPNDRSLLLRRLTVIGIVLSVVCALGVGCAVLFPSIFLWVLGNAYSNLERELVLVAVSSSLSLAVGLCVSLSFCRGLVPNPIIAISYNVVAQVVFMLCNDISSVAGVLQMGIGVSAAMTLFYIGYLSLAVGRQGHK